MPNFEENLKKEAETLRSRDTVLSTGLNANSFKGTTGSRLQADVAALRGTDVFDTLPSDDKRSVLDGIRLSMLGPTLGNSAPRTDLYGLPEVKELWQDGKSLLGKAIDIVPQPVRDVFARTASDMSKDMTNLERGVNPLIGVFLRKEGVEEIAKRAGPLGRVAGREIAGYVQAGTGGIIHPSEYSAPANLAENIAGVLGQIGGISASVGKLTQGINTIARKPQVIADFVRNFPIVGNFLVTTGAASAAFGTYGQLDPELGTSISNRAKRLGEDLALGGVFGALGFVPKGPYGIGHALAISADAGLGWGLAKLHGADDETALIWGISLGLLGTAHRLGGVDNPMITRNAAERMLAEESAGVLRKMGVHVPENYTDAHIAQLRRDALIRFHPDKVGSNKDIRIANEAINNLEHIPTNLRSKPNVEKESFDALKEELSRMFGRKVPTPPETPRPTTGLLPRPTTRTGNIPPEQSLQTVGGVFTDPKTGESFNLPSRGELESRPQEVEMTVTARINDLLNMVKTATGKARDDLKTKIAVLTTFRDAVQPLPRIVVDDLNQIPRTGNLRREFESRLAQVREHPPRTPEAVRAMTHFTYTTQQMGGNLVFTRGRFDPRLFLHALETSAPDVAARVREQSALINVEMREERQAARQIQQTVDMMRKTGGQAIEQVRQEAAKTKAEKFHEKVAQETAVEKEAHDKDRAETRYKAGVTAISNSTGLTRKAVSQYLEDFNLQPKDLIDRKPADIRDAVVKGEMIKEPEKEAAPVIPEDKQRFDDLRANTLFDQAWQETKAEMLELSQPGYRVMADVGNRGDLGTYGVPSTFPQWVPENLRSMDLFKKVVEHFDNETYPQDNAVRQIELYKAVIDHVGYKIETEIPENIAEMERLAQTPQFKIAKGMQDLTTTVLERVRAMTKKESVPVSMITDVLKQPGIKGPERTVIEDVLKDFGEEVNMKEFGDRVKAELLPLERTNVGRVMSEVFDAPASEGGGGQYQNVTLPAEQRGKVDRYDEHVYESPIKTSAGGVHFNVSRAESDADFPNYFAHTRVEDVPNDVRRVIEVQSDLFQKGRLEGEADKYTQSKYLEDFLPSAERKELESLHEQRLAYKEQNGGNPAGFPKDARITELEAKGEQLYKEAPAKREAELKKLEPYRNTWHERIIREEVARAAKDGKTLLQFPVGETAMKIEGLGRGDSWVLLTGGYATSRDLKVGMEILESKEVPMSWIITDVLGNGKFKAVPKEKMELWNPSKMSEFDKELYKNEIADPMKAVEQFKETFDISGKVDTNNPIYKFYENEVGKYLKNRYGAARTTDAQGVDWWQMNVKPEYADQPVEAFRFNPNRELKIQRTSSADMIDTASKQQKAADIKPLRSRTIRPFRVGTPADAERIITQIRNSPAVKQFYNEKSLALTEDFFKGLSPEMLGKLNVDVVNGLIQPPQDALWRKGIEGSYTDNLATIVLRNKEWTPETFWHEVGGHHAWRYLSAGEREVAHEAYEAAKKNESLYAEIMGNGDIYEARRITSKYVEQAKEMNQDINDIMAQEFFARAFERYANEATKKQMDKKASVLGRVWDALKNMFDRIKVNIGNLLGIARESKSGIPASLEKIFKDIYEPSFTMKDGKIDLSTLPARAERPFYDANLEPAYKFSGGESDRLVELRSMREGMIARGERTDAIDRLIARIQPTATPEARTVGEVINDRAKAQIDEIASPQEEISPERREMLMDIAEIEDAMPKWKDASAFGMSRETMERNIEKVAGDDAPMVHRFLTDPVLRNETERLKYITTLRSYLNKAIVQDLGIRPGSDESMYIQKWGEGKMTEDELTAAVPDETKRTNIKKASRIIRDQYDIFINMWNVERATYGLDPIGKQPNYFRHMHLIDNTIEKFGLFMSGEDLPTEIAGITDVFKPGTPFTSAALSREGFDTDFEALRGMDEYIDSVSKAIFHTDSVQRGRMLERAIRRTSKEAKLAASEAMDAGRSEDVPPQIELPRFVTNLTEWTNILSGKKGRMDRGIEDIFGRPFYQIWRAVGQKTGANMIAGNLSAALTNFIPLTASFATTNKPAALRALAEAVVQPGKITTVDGQESSFLTRRFAEKAIATRMLRLKDFIPQKLSPIEILRPVTTSLDNTAIDNASRIVFNIIDPFVSRAIVAGKYYEWTSKGIEPKEAMRRADKYAANVITDRTIGQLPNIFGQKVLGPVTQFQTEVNNQWSFYTKDIPKMDEFAGDKTKIAGVYLQLAVYSFLFNEIYERITGHRVTIDPIYAGMTILGMTPEGRDKSVLKKMLAVMKNVSGNLPFTGSIVSGRLPISAGFPDLTALARGETTVSRELIKPAAFLLSPIAGLQAKKTFEGIQGVIEGGRYTTSGNLSYPIEQTVGNYIQKGLFGQYADPQANEYFEQGLGPLSKKETTLYKKLLNAGQQDKGMTLYAAAQVKKYATREINRLKKQAEEGDIPTSVDIETARDNIMKYKQEILDANL